MVAGFATSAFVGLGFAFTAPAAWAAGPEDAAQAVEENGPSAEGGADLETNEGGPQTLDIPGVEETEFAYTCLVDDQNPPEEPDDIVLALTAAPTDAATGDEVAIEAEVGAGYWYREGNEHEPGSATLDYEVLLGGDGAPKDAFSLTAVGEEFTDAGEVDWSAATGSFTATKPGDITLTPGTVTIQGGGSTTVCKPEGAESFHTISVAGDPIEEPEPTPSDEPEPTPSQEPTGEDEEPTPEPTDGAGGGDDGEDKPTPEPSPTGDDGDQADGGLPVTGAALGGLVAAGAVALGGGGAAMYLSRKRKSAATGSTEES
ncbi:hypothetical protein GCM10022205_36120 [Spinactinospora alkalitolerans]